jgi:hypothetical protein
MPLKLSAFFILGRLIGRKWCMLFSHYRCGTYPSMNLRQGRGTLNHVQNEKEKFEKLILFELESDGERFLWVNFLLPLLFVFFSSILL